MIVVDASAILAVYLQEPEWQAFASKLAAADSLIVSPVNYWEVLVRAQTLRGDEGRDEAIAIITTLAIEVPPLDAEMTRAAADAFARFGRGQAANLNLGDCFAYALAASRQAPLLHKDVAFERTDIVSA